MLIYGKNAINEVLKTDQNIEKAYVTNNKNDNNGKDIIAKLKQKKVPIQFVDQKVLDKLCDNENNRGFAVVVSEFEYCDLESILQKSQSKGSNPFILVLDEIEDPHNLGSIIRSAECAGIDGIIIPKHRAVGVTDTVIRVAQGATAHMLIHKATNINNAIKTLKENNIFVYACDMDGDSIYRTNLKGGLAFVIGSEGFGVKQLTKSLCDGVVSLPLFGEINSLNASNASAVVVYEALRQRNGL